MEALREWQYALHSAGFVGLSWPLEQGGRGLDLSAEAVFAEELAKSSTPQLLNRLAVYTWGPTLMDLGTPEQCNRFLPGMLSASEIWCQGFSEPDAGSDLAAVRTAGVVDGDRVVISGQKVWTSRAELSKWNALLVRTGRGTERHKGLSVVIVDMESEGVTIRPLAQMLGEPHFSEVFFDDVEVPIGNVLGEVGRGWSVAMSAMSYERGLFVLERQIGLQKSLEALVGQLRTRALSGHEAPLVGRVAAQLALLRAHVYRTLASQTAGTLARGSTSVDKLFLAEVYQSLFSVAFDLEAEHATEPDGVWTHDLLESRSVSIYSGTSEIQRNVIASQLLNLSE
jgi:alkylation response protein AidB-like acyl-CoA dehydrogenase